MTVKFVKATPEDHKELTKLIRLSKNYWQYGAAQIEAWHKELSVTEEDINTNSFFKLIENQELIGFCSYILLPDQVLYLENLFIHPDFIGKGYGAKGMAFMLKEAATNNCTQILLDSDPNAESFYLKYGFVTYDQKQSSIEGRFLPKMRLMLD